MNQTQKRLQIINIAISITDIETIQLQMLKLSSLRSDTKLKEILDGLQAQNYAQTQALITKYLETPTEEIVQRTSQNDQEIIEEFDLFLTTPEEAVKKETELFDFNLLEKEVAKNTTQKQSIDFDNLLNLTADDIMSDNIQLNINHIPEDTFFDISEENISHMKESHIDTDFIPKDTFFDNIEKDKTIKNDTSVLENSILHEKNSQKQKSKKNFISEEKSNTSQETIQKEANSLDYQNIPYIDQKLKNMLTQYPPLIQAQENYETVSNWLLKISNEGYSEKEVEEVISHVGKLKKNNAVAEAAQLLLISGATESKYAQFILARELFKGEILEKNLPEAFTLINRLAMDDDYPEAICDLAQFFENGIGIDKDKKRAEMLYKEAMELGVKRAASHYERLHTANKSLFGKLFGK